MRNTKTLFVVAIIAALVLLSACDGNTPTTRCRTGMYDDNGKCCDDRECNLICANGFEPGTCNCQCLDGTDSGDSGIDNIFDDEGGDITPPDIPG